MQSQAETQNEIEFVKILKTISQAYQEISVMRMQKIRNNVLSSRKFLDSLSDVFQSVKVSYGNYYKGKVVKVKKNSSILSLSTNLPRNGKTILVFISPNNKLYGDIGDKVYKGFLEYIDKNKSDIMIMGKLGKEMFKQDFPNREFIYEDLPENESSLKSTERIIGYFLKYQTTNIVHGEFDSVLTQRARLTNISGESFEDIHFSSGKAIEHKFLFEPSLVDLVNFFESQVFKILFRQTLHESDLSKHASRIRSMENALGNIEKKEKFLYFENLREKNKAYNKKQLESLLGVSVWKK